MTAPIMHFPTDGVAVSAPSTLYADVGKRLFDIAFLLIVAPVVVMTLALMTGAIWATGGSPFYAQPRVGRNGKIFKCWKMRTMVADADAALERILAEDADLAREWAVNQKLGRDPRITLLGRFLRKTSLDELPQVWNVLRGEMSVVGPRPFTPEQRDLYPLEAAGHTGYYALRPGITGLWQVSRRNSGSFAERARYDLAYAHSISLASDIRIILKTADVVVRGTGV